MNLDVSPDGKNIVFDMVGDIYIMPITGGKAKVLRGGIPFEIQPRFNFSRKSKIISNFKIVNFLNKKWVKAAVNQMRLRITAKSKLVR